MKRITMKSIFRTCSLFITVCAGILYGQAADWIYPVPQKADYSGGNLELHEKISICVPEKPEEKDAFLAQFLVEELVDRYRLALRVEKIKDLKKTSLYIVMGSCLNPLVKELVSEYRLHTVIGDLKPEGYVLLVNEKGILIAGRDDR